MKKMFLVLAIVCMASLIACTREREDTVYVSARGNDSNSGLRENQPITFAAAMEKVNEGTVKKVIIIGTLDMNSGNINRNAVLNISVDSNVTGEITITGKPRAGNAKRAVLSGLGTDVGGLSVYPNAKVRLEHILISSGGGDLRYGVFVEEDAELTLGKGVVICNTRIGIVVEADAACTIDGAEIYGNSLAGAGINGVLNLRSGAIRDNSGTGNAAGVLIQGGGHFTMSGGVISGNKTGTTMDYYGGGVYVYDGIFTMTGGKITNNTAKTAGGGVAVRSTGSFEQTGGAITGNIAPLGINVYGVFSTNPSAYPAGSAAAKEAKTLAAPKGK